MTHFVKPKSKVDLNAKKLCATVYGNAKTFHMLPKQLSKEKCSLKPGKLRLTFSLILNYTKDGELIDKWIGKGYIKSACRLTYEQAENIIENKKNIENIKIYNNFNCEQVEKVVNELNNLSNKIWQMKNKKGRYTFSNEKLEFEMNYETHKPISLYMSKQLKAHCLVETFMCAANETVANFLNEKFKNGGTLVRRHLNTKDLVSKLHICKALRISSNFAKLNFNEFINYISTFVNKQTQILVMNYLVQNTEKSMFIFLMFYYIL